MAGFYIPATQEDTSTICKPKAKNPEIDLQNKVEPDDFVYVARRLECDEDKERFEKKLARLLRWNRVVI